MQKFHKEGQCDHFFLKLCKEFETVRSNLMKRIPAPSLNELWGITQGMPEHGDQEEDVHMHLPLGLPSFLWNMVWKLHSSLYGLKQALGAWFDKF